LLLGSLTIDDQELHFFALLLLFQADDFTLETRVLMNEELNSFVTLGDLGVEVSSHGWNLS
jgi:hypothetical protein